MNFDDYKKLPGINASFLKACHQSPFDGWHYLHNPPEPSDAMEFGSAVHAMLLEPTRFSQLVAVSHKIDKRTKAGKEAAAAFEAEHAGKIIIDQDEFNLIQTIARNCKAIPHVAHALEAFDKEKVFTWNSNGINFKARLDLVSESIGAIIDIKTTKDARPHAFTRQIMSFSYHLQLLHYAKTFPGIAPNTYAVAIESESGQVACYDLTKIVYSDRTKTDYERAIKIAIEVQKMSQCPPKFTNEIIELTLPAWAIEGDVV